MHGLKLFAIVLPVFLLLDMIWLGVLMHGFYDRELAELARRQAGAMAPRWGAALLVYVLIPAGIVLFVRPHLGESATSLRALAWGALYGLVVYGVYDLTNLAVLERWSLRMTLADIAWGCALCGLSAVAMHSADRWLSQHA